jgi:CheY-like chemotaxis protein
MTMALSVLDTGCLLATIENEAGKNHATALKMQNDHGTDAITSQQSEVDFSGMGSSSSTFLGMGEMQEAAALLGASLSLVFYPESGLTAAHTLFSLTTGLRPTVAPKQDNTDVPPLREGIILVCVDDDQAQRIGYKGLVKKLKVTQSLILGGTHQEAFGVVELILSLAEAHGDENVVCILDQNMDYTEGNIKGTEIVAELRQSGFKGVVFIRSANDDDVSGNMYRAAGANAYLSKKANVKQLARDVVRECELVWTTMA